VTCTALASCCTPPSQGRRPSGAPNVSSTAVFCATDGHSCMLLVDTGGAHRMRWHCQQCCIMLHTAFTWRPSSGLTDILFVAGIINTPGCLMVYIGLGVPSTLRDA
jgi:hypothetical protein